MSESYGTVSYRDVPGFPGYRVGDDGSVWGCRGRGFAAGTFGAWRKMNPDKQRSGHLLVRLCSGRKENFDVCSVHRLVLEAFVGPCPEGMEACHYPDRDPGNNRLENLRWDTRKNNREDMRKHGTLPLGEKHGKSKLNSEQVRQIRILCNSGMTYKKIAEKFGMAQTTVSAIRNRKIWKSLED